MLGGIMILHVKIFDAPESQEEKVNLQMLSSDGKYNIALFVCFVLGWKRNTNLIKF